MDWVELLPFLLDNMKLEKNAPCCNFSEFCVKLGWAGLGATLLPLNWLQRNGFGCLLQGLSLSHAAQVDSRESPVLLSLPYHPEPTVQGNNTFQQEALSPTIVSSSLLPPCKAMTNDSNLFGSLAWFPSISRPLCPQNRLKDHKMLISLCPFLFSQQCKQEVKTRTESENKNLRHES